MYVKTDEKMRQLDNKAIGLRKIVKRTNHVENRNEENSVFTYFLLIFYCYLLIFVNELRVNISKSIYYKSKKMKFGKEQSRTLETAFLKNYQSETIKNGVFCPTFESCMQGALVNLLAPK